MAGAGILTLIIIALFILANADQNLKGVRKRDYLQIGETDGRQRPGI